MISPSFSHRVYLRKKQTTSFHPTLGVDSPNILSHVGTSPSASVIRGFVVPNDMDLRNVFVRAKASSSVSTLKWVTRIIRVKPNGEVIQYPSLEHNPASTDAFVYQELNTPDPVLFEAGDLVSLSFERTDTSGSSTHYLYADGVFDFKGA